MSNFTADMLKELERWGYLLGRGIGESDYAQLATAIALSRIADALLKTLTENGE